MTVRSITSFSATLADLITIRVAPKAIAAVFAALAICISSTHASAADEKAVLAGLKEVKIAFDLKDGDPKILLSSLNAVDDTRRALIERGVAPNIVLAFRGPASKLVQTDLSEVAAEHQAGAAKVAEKIAVLREATGIGRMEQCGLTVAALGLNEGNTLPGVKVVRNSWTSLAAYQARG